MSKLSDGIERLIFGATTQERVDMLAELAARRALARLATALASDGPAYDAVYDEALSAALARGMNDTDAHSEAFRLADEWKAAQGSTADRKTESEA